jgi:hypothetical protein
MECVHGVAHVELLNQPAIAGDGIKPGVERSGTPGQRTNRFNEPAIAGDSG